MTIDAALNKRLARVVRRHERMKANGVVHRVGKDGLIRARPRLFKFEIPYVAILTVFAVGVLFKSVVYAQMGAGDYVEKVEVLQAGTLFEKAGAFFMQEDRVTTALGEAISPIFFGS